MTNPTSGGATFNRIHSGNYLDAEKGCLTQHRVARLNNKSAPIPHDCSKYFAIALSTWYVVWYKWNRNIKIITWVHYNDLFHWAAARTFYSNKVLRSLFHETLLNFIFIENGRILKLVKIKQSEPTALREWE